MANTKLTQVCSNYRQFLTT